MEVKKINQSYAYCNKQIAWIKRKFHKDVRIMDMDKKRTEKEFLKKFGISRTFRALEVKAKRLGVRNKIKPLTVGKSMRKAKKGECAQVCVSTNPVRYLSLARYVYQNHHEIELDDSDVVIHLDGNPNNCDISNLDVLSRMELLMANRMPNTISMETRSLIAKVESRVANLSGRGEWSKEEVEWVLSQKVPEEDKRGFWVKKAKEFNKIFNKNRTNRCVMMIYYRK